MRRARSSHEDAAAMKLFDKIEIFKLNNPALPNPKKSSGLARNTVFGPDCSRNLGFVFEAPGLAIIRYLSYINLAFMSFLSGTVAAALPQRNFWLQGGFCDVGVLCVHNILYADRIDSIPLYIISLYERTIDKISALNIDAMGFCQLVGALSCPASVDECVS